METRLIILPKKNDKNNNNKQGHDSRPPKKKRNRYYRRERRAIERAERGEMFKHDAWWATQHLGAPSSSPVPDRLTQPGLLHSDPISAMRPTVYSPDTLVDSPTANDNSPFHFDQELGESAGLYKPADPDPQYDTWTSSFRAEQLGNRTSLSSQNFRSEQLKFQEQDRDCLPPSATPATS